MFYEVGDLIKVVRQGQRFWVIVVAIEEDIFYGLVDNDVFDLDFECEDIVEFFNDEIKYIDPEI